MINYCFNYYKIINDYCDEGTMLFDSRTERAEAADKMLAEGYTITDVYENEDCYCHARSWSECGCGNFKE